MQDNIQESIYNMRESYKIYDLLRQKIDPGNIKYEIIKGAIHNESAWEERFPEIIKFLFN